MRVWSGVLAKLRLSNEHLQIGFSQKLRTLGLNVLTNIKTSAIYNRERANSSMCVSMDKVRSEVKFKLG